MKKVVAALLVLGALGMMPAMSHAANANQCKDAKGKFIKCPAVVAKPTPAVVKATPAASTASTKCRDAKGKFIKCPTTAAAATPKPKTCRDAKGKFIKCAA